MALEEPQQGPSSPLVARVTDTDNKRGTCSRSRRALRCLSAIITGTPSMFCGGFLGNPYRSAVCRLTRGATLAVILLAAPSVVAARSITVAWDPNPEPSVSGYVVYVGREPGVYTGRYDVGNTTSFVYAEAVDNQSYYFSVAAYSTDLLPGPRSQEVSTIGTPFVAPMSLTYAEPVRSAASPAAATRSDSFAPAQICADTATHECYTVRTLIQTPRPITGLAAASDDRVFFIDSGQQIRVIVEGRLVALPALTISDAAVRLSGIALDSAFTTTHFVYVGEVEVARDGSHELSVVRYRELQGVLGERAVIIPALAFPSGAEGVFTTDSAGRIYVAMPSAEDARSTRDAYNGFILRFNPNGTVPSQNSNASPILARGFDQPSAFVWNGEGQLLVTGLDPASSWLSRLDIGAPAVQWPRALGPVSVTTGSAVARGNSVFVIDRANRLTRLLTTPDGPADADVIALPDSKRAIAAAAGARSKTYVVASPAIAGNLSILELTPLPLP